MMIKRCDGCARDIGDRDLSVTVARGDSGNYLIRDAVLPDAGRPLHWCRPCAITAVAAVTGRT